MARRRPNEPTVNPARGAALVVAAVLLGLVLLRNGLDTSVEVTASNDDRASDEGTDSSADAGTDEGTDDTTDTTEPARSPAQVTVIVLNGTSVSGAAGKYTTAVGSAGYKTLEASDATTKIPTTQVFFAPGYEREAAAVAIAAGAPATVTPVALPAPPPGEIGAANVVVIIGADIANLTPTTAASTTTTASG